MGGDDSKTEPATPKRRSDERKKGHVMMSRDAVGVVSLFAAIAVLRLTFGNAAQAVADFTVYCLTLASGALGDGISDNLFIQTVGVVARAVGPLMAICILASAAATMAQTRLLVTTEPLKPKLSKLNPISGFKRLFSLKSLIMAGLNLLKIILLLILVFFSLRDLVEVAARFLYADISGSARYILEAIYSLLLKIGLAFLVLAAIDFLYQHFDYEKGLRMSKQEIKDEYKQSEGDPQIKGKIKQMQRQLAQSRMMQQVPKSDVIIRNPTHVAVALRYHPGEDSAPVVLAMGLDYLAQRIIDVAQTNDIIIIENVALARALYAEAELNRPIPPDLYEAVAEVMVYLYKLGRIQA